MRPAPGSSSLGPNRLTLGLLASLVVVGVLTLTVALLQSNKEVKIICQHLMGSDIILVFYFFIFHMVE